jgi:hypothetical protein
VLFTVKIGFSTLAALLALRLAVPFLHAEQAAPQIVASATKCELPPSERSIPLKQTAAGSLAKQLDAILTNRSMHLRLSNLQAVRPPGVLYAVYLEPVGTTTRSDTSPVGYLNFFSISAGAKGNSFSFEVTELVRALLGAKPDLTGLQVRIVPGGTPESTPSVGSIELISY